MCLIAENSLSVYEVEKMLEIIAGLSCFILLIFWIIVLIGVTIQDSTVLNCTVRMET